MLDQRQISIKRLGYVAQGKRSANCGPCSLKMIADYYGISHPRGGQFSVQSINRLLKTTTQWGTEPKDLHRVAKRLGLIPRKVGYDHLEEVLKQGHPVVGLFMDEGNQGHYALISGLKGDELVFHDSYWGKRTRRKLGQFKKMAAPFRHWLYAYLPGPT